MAVTVPEYDADGAMTGSVELPAALFDAQPHEAALHAYVKLYMANQRQGTVKTKTRAEVSGGGAKPWRQKGTGRARAGSNRSPVWVGGGRAFGPRPRDLREKLPRKVRRLALVSALTLKAREGAIRVWDRPEMEHPKTKPVADVLAKMGLGGRKVLFLYDGIAPNLVKSCRNIRGLMQQRADLTNAYSLLRVQDVVLSPAALKRMIEVWS